MTPVYRSPSWGSAAAATTPARLAEEFDQVLWRKLPDGSLEVAVKRDGRVEHLQVHDDGSTSPLATVTVRSVRWATVLAGSGVALGFLSVGLGMLGAGEKVLPVFIASGVMFLVGWAGSLSDMDLHVRLRPWKGWHRPTLLNGWAPQTSAQLAAVERIADEHGGLAYVCDSAAATVDVRATRRTGLDRFTVDDRGIVEELDQAVTGSQKLFDRVYIPFAIVIVIGFSVIGAHFGSDAGGIVGFVIAVVVTASLWHRTSAERLTRDADSVHWIEIRTREPNSD
jgi:hypothetical protein